MDHPGHHFGSEDERGQMAQIGVVSITKAIRTEDVPSPRPAVEIISRKEHESVDEETGVPRLDDDATSRLERAIFENAPINHATGAPVITIGARRGRTRAPVGKNC